MCSYDFPLLSPTLLTFSFSPYLHMMVLITLMIYINRRQAERYVGTNKCHSAERTIFTLSEFFTPFTGILVTRILFRYTRLSLVFKLNLRSAVKLRDTIPPLTSSSRSLL